MMFRLRWTLRNALAHRDDEGRLRLVRFAVLVGSLLGFVIVASAYPDTAIGDDRLLAAPLVAQLESRRYSERQAAFFKLCDPQLDIDAWLEEQTKSGDGQRASLCRWLQRLRSVPGSLEERLAMMRDYQTLASGDLSIIQAYVDNRRIEVLVDLIEMLPESTREGLILYRSSDNPFDAIIDGAWRDGCEDVLPRLLNAILPKSPIRVGLNGRWKSIGMPDSWHVEEPLDIPEVAVAALERDGRIDEAIATAKRKGLIAEYEQLLLRHARWDQWLALDPTRQLVGGTASWIDLEKAILLESLGRHEEAEVYYELRRTSKAKGVTSQIQLAQLSFIVGNEAGWVEPLKTHAREELIGVLFLRNDLQQLLELEDLTALTNEAVDRWFDEAIKSGKPLTKPIRFQSLFKRLGRNDLEEHVYQRIASFVATSEREQQLRQWDGILSEWSRYSLDERRLLQLAKLADQYGETDSSSDASGLARRMQAVGDPKSVTLETIFFKNFTNIRSAAYPLYVALRVRTPKATPKSTIAMLEDINVGRLPAGWDVTELERFFRDTVRSSLSDPGQVEPMLVDMADVLDVMGRTESALELLQDFADSHAANLMVAQYASKLGRLDEGAQLGWKLVDQHPDDVNAYLSAGERLAEAHRFDDWMRLQRRTLSRLDTWELVERYFQTARRRERLETQPEILFTLELLGRNHPSTWYEIWFGDAYSKYGARILTDWYHRTIAKHPERIDALASMSRLHCLSELRSLADEQSPDAGGMGGSARWELDWAMWSMQYERCIAAGFWQAVKDGDRELADRLIRTAYRLYPEQINTLIDAVGLVRDRFGDAVLREWFDVYYRPMSDQLERFPDDTLTANNTAWLAAKCGFELDRALVLAQHVVDQNPIDTYLDTLAEIEFVRGNVDRAIEVSERCRAMQPRDSHHRQQIERFRAHAKNAVTGPE